MAENEDLDLGEEGKGSKKKLIIIIVLALVLLGGGGGAAWFFLMGDEAPPEGEQAATQKTTEEEEEEPADEHAPPIYHPFKPLFIVELPPGGKKKMLQLELQVLTHQAKVDAFLTTNDPMVRHHILNLLSEQTGEMLGSAEGKQQLRQAIIDKIKQLMKENGKRGEIDNVFFSQFVLQ